MRGHQKQKYSIVRGTVRSVQKSPPLDRGGRSVPLPLTERVPRLGSNLWAGSTAGLEIGLSKRVECCFASEVTPLEIPVHGRLDRVLTPGA